ncbi:MAG: TolC family protein [Alistipes sp.]|jgi:outer membrane protein|nr:TolC family protein [Alistipes sp.]
MRRFILISVFAVCVLAASAQGGVQEASPTVAQAGMQGASQAGAQEGGMPEKWTLRDCIDHALEHNIELRQRALEVKGAEIDLNTAQNSRLPNLSARVGQDFSFGRKAFESGDSYVFRNTQAAGTSFGMSAEMPVFQGFRINNQIKAGRLDMQAATAGLDEARQNMELNIAGFFLDALLKKEILAVATEQTALTTQQMDNTRLMVDAGKLPLSQLYEIEAAWARDTAAEVRAEGDVELALLALAQALDLENSAAFDVSEPDIDISAYYEIPLSPESVYDTALATKPAVREAELLLESSRHGVRVAQSARWPSLSLGASVGDNYEYMFGQSGQQSFADQMRNRHSENIGLNLSIPIFNRNATRNSVRTARLGVENRILALEGVRLALHKEVQQAWQGALTARASWEATLLASIAARESFRATELRYTAGKATVYEYSEAAKMLFESQSEQARSKYEFLFRTRILDFYAGVPIDF